MNKCIKIFLLHGAFQESISEHIRKYLFNETEEMFYITEQNISESKIDDNKLVIPICWSIHVAKNYLKQISDIIEEYILKKYDIEIFMSDTSWGINSLVFSKFKKKVKISIFPDGLGFFSNSEFSKYYYFRTIIKKIYLRCKGIQFDVFKGNIFGLDRKEVYKIYTFLPEYTPGNPRKHEYFELALDEKSISEESNICCIIGDTYYRLIKDNADFDSFFRNYFEYAKNIGADKIYYKPHPREYHIEASRIYDLLVKYNIELIRDNETFEDYYTKVLPKYVISIASSSLLNINVLYPDNKSKIIAYGTEYILENFGTERNDIDKIIKIYNNFNVKIVPYSFSYNSGLNSEPY